MQNIWLCCCCAAIASVALAAHADVASLETCAGLLCLKQAKDGGLSGWSSSVSVYNELLRTSPELVPLMASHTEWFFDRKGEVPPGKQPYMRIPIFNLYQARISHWAHIGLLGVLHKSAC